MNLKISFKLFKILNLAVGVQSPSTLPSVVYDPLQTLLNTEFVHMGLSTDHCE
jgi:hypothetical protein